MADDGANETRLVRSIERRRLARGLLLFAPIVAVWIGAGHWLEQRLRLQPDIVGLGGMMLLIGLSLLLPRSLTTRWSRDQRETTRTRWLIRERADRLMAHSRALLVLGLAGLLLVQCVALLGHGSRDTALSDANSIVSLLLVCGIQARWRPERLHDEGERLRYLTAANRAFIVTMLAGVGAMLLDVLRDDLLRPALVAVLMSGMLTFQASLLIEERRAAVDGD